MDNYSLNSGIHNQSGTGTSWAKESLSNQKSILNVSYSTTNQTSFYTESPMENGTFYYYKYEKWTLIDLDILIIIRTVISIFGIPGNGMVIWLLGCRIKKNHFTTYILNLAIADFSYLIVAVICYIEYTLSEAVPQMSLEIFRPLSVLLYPPFLSTSQLLLTAISVDRCVSVFFPLWHRYHRPKHLSAILCALIWVISFIPPAINYILEVTKLWTGYAILDYQFIVNGFLCLPLMTISSLMLFIKVCCKSKQRRKRKILTTILIAVSFFLFFCFPFNALITIRYFFAPQVVILPQYALFCATLNSSVNPFIYYLVGRPKTGRSNKSMKVALQELCQEAETESHLPENSAATPV